MNEPGYALFPKLLFVGLFISIILPVTGQNCDVDFPGTSVRNFSTTCGGSSSSDLTLGKNTYMGNGDSFTFNSPTIINVTGNLSINAQGSGKIIIPAGVTVNVAGNFQLDQKNSGCSSGNPCTFEIEVNGTINISGNLQNYLVNLVWSGTGTVDVSDDFQNSSNGCMRCAAGGCPNFDVNSSDCSDDGVGCSGGDFCTLMNSCASDVTDPVITGCPSNRIVNVSAGTCAQTVSWTVPTATDNCSLSSFNASHSPGSSFPKGTTSVTYTATDARGNTATCSFNVTVVDNVVPVITGCPTNITVNANTSCQAGVTWTAPTLTDNCTGGTLTSNLTSGSTFNKGVTAVIYTATDAAGNVATCSFNVTVVDNVLPVITGCPTNITVSATCQAVVTWTPPTFTDNCIGATLSANRSPGSTFSSGLTVVTYTATDAAGNVATCSFNVIVVDNVLPVVIGCPTNITVNANTSCQAIVNWTPPTFTDNCPGGTLTSSLGSGSTFNKGVTTVTYTATDAAGNMATCSFNVTVVGNVPPVITGCPTNIIVNANAVCQSVVSWTPPTFTENCAGGTFTSDRTPGSIFNKGITAVTYTATDAAGNVATCSFTVTVVDKVLPVITGCPTNLSVNANASCETIVNWATPTFTDNCTGGTLTSNKSPGTIFTQGTTAVTYTATDASGNISTCSFNVTVLDNIPVFKGCPEDIVMNAAHGETTTVFWEIPTVESPCSAFQLTSTHNPGDVFDIGQTRVKYSATTENQISAVCEFVVSIETTVPEIIANEIVTPDGDNKNDVWLIENIEKFPDNDVIVFDRWGGIVFKGARYNNSTIAWSGHNVPTGTYYYTLLVDVEGNKIEKKGFIELIK